MKVIEFTGHNVNDIPRGLRALADQIEQLGGAVVEGQQVARVMNLVWLWIDETGETSIGALGTDIDKWRVAGLCQHAVMELLAPNAFGDRP